MAADPPVIGYPLRLFTDELIDRLHKIWDSQGREAALAYFREVVANEPWFQQPGSHGPLKDSDRIEWEFGCIMTGEGEGM